MTKVYKIKRNDGLFSTGGMNPKFSKTGKIWTSMRYLKSHLTLVKENKTIDEYNNCIIIIYDLVETCKTTISHFEFLGTI